MRHIFGVPGDYNLELVQHLEDRGRPEWVGCCNELNASFASDGYARLNGISALVVTNGVGALSAINGIAGSHCEHVPVVCICGSIPLNSMQHGLLMHHTLADGGLEDRFRRMFAEVTVAQALITPENAACEIDRLILAAWRRKLPVYLELPSDVGFLEIDVPEAPLQLSYQASDRERLNTCLQQILTRLREASDPALLLGMDADRYGVMPQLRALAEILQIPVATMTGAKAVFPEESPLFVGIYNGSEGRPELRRMVEESDCLLAVGFRKIDWITGFFTDNIPKSTIHLNGQSTDVGGENFQGVFLGELLTCLAKEASSSFAKVANRKHPVTPAFSSLASESLVTSPSSSGSDQRPLRQKDFWEAMQHFIKPGDVIVAEAGTSIAGSSALCLPKDADFISQAVWGSIGASVGSLLGTLLAARERRQILLVGDGSFQLTCQEVSTMMAQGLKPLIFLINNSGYTVERTILGRTAKCNDIANWKYTEVVKAFSRTQEIETCVVGTLGELQPILSAQHNSLLFVEVVMDRFDSPPSLVRFGHSAAKINFGSRGPQFAKGAQITEDEGHSI